VVAGAGNIGKRDEYEEHDSVAFSKSMVLSSIVSRSELEGIKDKFKVKSPKIIRTGTPL
jgi:hypothetical protein